MNSGLRPRLLPALWLVALLLLAQALGLAHRIEHAWHPHHGDEAAGVSLGHEAGGAECRLIDQYGLGEGLCGGPSLAAPATWLPTWVAGQAVAAVFLPARAGYRARAPPG